MEKRQLKKHEVSCPALWRQWITMGPILLRLQSHMQSRKPVLWSLCSPPAPCTLPLKAYLRLCLLPDLTAWLLCFMLKPQSLFPFGTESFLLGFIGRLTWVLNQAWDCQCGTTSSIQPALHLIISFWLLDHLDDMLFTPKEILREHLMREYNLVPSWDKIGCSWMSMCVCVYIYTCIYIYIYVFLFFLNEPIHQLKIPTTI